jgi:hypothetical protein
VLIQKKRESDARSGEVKEEKRGENREKREKGCMEFGVSCAKKIYDQVCVHRTTAPNVWHGWEDPQNVHVKRHKNPCSLSSEA